MKKLLVVLFVFSIVGGYVFGAPVTDVTDELKINGLVSPILNVTVESGDIDLGQLVLPATGEVDGDKSAIGNVRFFANVLHTATWSSDNAGDGVDFRLKLDGVENEYISYNFSFDDESKIGQRGSHLVDFTVDGLAYTGENGVPLAGTYSDTITFTVTAN